MNKELKYDANYIKTLIVDYFIEQYRDITIGNEVMYGTEKRLVDILILKSGRTTAIEVKSKYDSFARLESQIVEYRKTFNYIYIGLDESFITKLDNMSIFNDIGVIIITKDGKLKIHRKAKIQQKLQKKEMLQTVNIEYIKRNYSNLFICNNTDEVRYILEKKSVKIIKALLYAFLMHKIEPRYKVFLSQRGSCTHTDDLFLLSFPSKEIL